MTRPITPLRTASSGFLAWLLLPSFIGYLLAPSQRDVHPLPEVIGCGSVPPTAEMVAVYDVEMANDFDVTAVCCNAWSFTGGATGNNPTLTLTRGVTYTFGLTGGASHPFAIRATAGGANLAGPFTAATFTFTPDFVMPTNMVYQCAIHSPMLGNIVLVNPNTAPNATNLSAAETFTEEVALNLTDIVVTDADNTTTTAMLTLSAPAAGSLNTGTSGAVTSTYNAGTGIWTASGLIANVNTLLAGLTFTPAVNFSSNFTIATSVSDGIAAAVTGSKAMTAIGVNDAPTLGNATLLPVNEDTPNPGGPSVSTIFTGQFADVDPGASFGGIAVLGNTANAGTQGTWQYSSTAGTTWFAIGTVNPLAALAVSSASLIRFLPALNFNGTPPELSVRGLDNTYAAGFSTTEGIQSRVTVNTSTSGGSTPIANAVSTIYTTVWAVNDPPTATGLFASETYTEDVPKNLIDIVASDVDNTPVEATLTLSNTAAGSFNTATSGTTTSTYNAGTGVWTAIGPIGEVNTLLAGLTFTPSLNSSINSTILTSVSDGELSMSGFKQLTGTPVNDAPTASNMSAGESYTEDTPLNLVDIVTADVDNASLTVILHLSNPAAGSLNTATSGAVISTYNAGSGQWSASGAIANVNTLLAGLTFTPALNFSGSFTMTTLVVGDGPGGGGLVGDKPVAGTAVNDPPSASNLSAAETYTEDVVLNLIDLVASDVDNANVTAALTLSNTAAGSLNTGTSGAVTSTYIAGTGVWTASGAIANVNTLLAGLTFTPAADFDGAFTISTSVSDAIAAPATGNKAMSGTAVNDAPSASNLNAAENYTQDTPLDLVDIVTGDVDNVNLDVTLTLSNTAAGSLTTATSGTVTSTYTAGTGVWQASGAVADVNTLLAGVNFLPASGFTSSFAILTSVSDAVAPVVSGSKAMTGTPTTVAVAVAARVLLEGAYSAGTGLMNDALRAAGVLPAAEPFTGLGYVHVGGGGETAVADVFTTTGSDAIVDWVVLELRDMVTPATIVATRSALVQCDGDVVDMDGVSPVSFSVPAGSYHVAVRHRNHLGCMTGTTVALSAAPTSVDFTSPATSLFGTAAVKSVSGAFPAQALWAGDATFNGLVQYTGAGNDRDPILVTVGSTTPNNVVSNIYSTRDVNMNTEVKYTGSGNDRDPILVNVGNTTPNNVRAQQLP